MLQRATEAMLTIPGLRIYGTAPGKAAVISFLLSAVDADHGATAMGIGGYLGHGVDGAENIRHMA